MATKSKVARSKTQGKEAKAPAAVLREQKARIEEIHANSPPPPSMPTSRHPASDAAEAAEKARDVMGNLPVPMTLNEICALMGPDCKAEDFAASALKTLAGQLYAVAQFAESGLGGDGGYEQWQVIENIVERMKCAGEVVTWLESETTELPEVQP